MLKFTVFYIINMFILFLIFNYQETIDFQFIYTNILNHIAVFFINSIGIDALHSGIDIILPTSILKVLFGCNGLEAILIFASAVLAFKAKFDYKIKYLLQGIVIISIINVFRIVILAYVIEIHKNYFNFMHEYVTQHIMIFLAILFFLIFTSNSKTHKSI